MQVNGVEYRMNRILRVTVVASDGVDGDGKPRQAEHVIEFCPWENENLNARMEVTAKEVPIVNSRHNGPGFSAKIKIYNPPLDLLTTINNHISWSIQSKNLDAYYKERCRVYVDAGYWEDKAKTKKPDDKKEETQNKGGSNYTRIFSGWLNTSAYYRKGVDNVLEMFCHSIQILDQENQEMIKAIKNISQESYSKVVYNEKKQSPLVGGKQKSWEDMLLEIIQKYAPLKAPKTIWGQLKTDRARNLLLAPVPVTAEDRTDIKKFVSFPINYIYEPTDTRNPEGVKKTNQALANQARTMNTEKWVINGGTFEEKIQQMCDRFPGGLRWVEDKSYDDGKNRYYFWLPAGQPVTWNKKKTNVPIQASDPDIIFYNFQNFLEVPSIDGAGQLKIKMMFNPAVRPNNKIQLKWVDNLTHNGVISPLTKGINTTAQSGQYYPSLQGGQYSIYAAAILNTNGDIFNTVYTATYITHTLHTHSNTWSTEIKTSALAVKPKGS